MDEEIIAPFKKHDHIREIAENFLKEYHLKDSFPTPIEEIVEFKLKLDIIPIPGLHKAFDIDGFLSSDRKSISVDDGIYQSRLGRYRFTLAHEVGHFILHKDLYEKQKFKTADDWKEFIKRFPEKQYNWFEWQAYEFAGLVLVPSHHLERRLKLHSKKIRSLGIKDDEVVLDRAIEFLGEDFVVSRDVIYRRLRREFKRQGKSNSTA